MTTAAKEQAKVKRRSERPIEARIAQLEEIVERMKANHKILEREVERLRGMLLLVKR